MSERNVQLLEKTMQHIKDHPEDHMQSMWVCGTSACFAGWASILNGMTFEGVEHLSYRIPVRDESGACHSLVYLHAQKVLGLTRDEATILFGGCNSIPMLELMVKDLVNGEDLGSPNAYAKEVISANNKEQEDD
jgi:hypothetical protein